VVTQRLCPRCHTVLHFEDDASLVFCTNCGAPQVILSEDLLAQAVEQATEQAAAEVPDSALSSRLNPPVGPGAVDWLGAIRCAGFAGAAAAALSLLSIPVPAISLISFFWALSAPIVVLGIYSSRFKQTKIRPGFGARLGLLSGIAVVVAGSLVNTVELLLRRFVFHKTAAVDSWQAEVFANLHTQLTEQSGPAAAPFLSFFNIPEFRVGLLIGVFALGATIYLVLSTVGGAFGGLLRSRTRAQ
jgi:hypothetical protein